jgi:NTP pyrophosphatase (non-canonical NTP hydrolase)
MKDNTKSELEELTDLLIQFRDARNWEQFHNSKDLALALSIEAAELNELFLWKKAEEVNIEKLKEELADILIFALLLARKHKFPVKDIILNKIRVNEQKYPAEKAKNTAKKYSEL